MRLLVTGPTAPLDEEQTAKLREHLIWAGESYDEGRIDADGNAVTAMVLLHSARPGVEAAAVEIAKELGWSVLHTHDAIQANDYPAWLDQALVIWPGLTETPEREMTLLDVGWRADAGVPVDVRHL